MPALGPVLHAQNTCADWRHPRHQGRPAGRSLSQEGGNPERKLALPGPLSSSHGKATRESPACKAGEQKQGAGASQISAPPHAERTSPASVSPGAPSRPGLSKNQTEPSSLGGLRPCCVIRTQPPPSPPFSSSCWGKDLAQGLKRGDSPAARRWAFRALICHVTLLSAWPTHPYAQVPLPPRLWQDFVPRGQQSWATHADSPPCSPAPGGAATGQANKVSH